MELFDVLRHTSGMVLSFALSLGCVSGFRYHANWVNQKLENPRTKAEIEKYLSQDLMLSVFLLYMAFLSGTIWVAFLLTASRHLPTP